jgi:hypothetical protein
MAKLVYGLNQSLDGYVDHLEIGPPSMKASALSRDTPTVRVVRLAFFFPCKDLFSFLHSTQARSMNPSVETGSTNHLFGHRTSDHDSFFRRRDRSREQGAQSAQR